MKTTPFRKYFTIDLKLVLFLSSVPHAWGTPDKKLGCMHCIMFRVISRV